MMAPSVLSTAQRVPGPSCSGTVQHCRPAAPSRRPHVACAATGEASTTTVTRTLETPSASASGFDSYDSYFANARRSNAAPSSPPAATRRSPAAPTPTPAQPLPSGPFAVMAPVPRRASGPTPRPVPIVHSSAFIHASDCDDGHAVEQVPDEVAARHKSELRRVMEEMEEEQQSGNALQSVLKRVDRSLDELERNPVPIQKAMAEIGRSPAGQATSKGLEAAAKLTISAAREAVKAAVPVGKWALREGVKAGASLLSKAVVEGTKAQLAQSSKSKARQQDGAAKGDKK